MSERMSPVEYAIWEALEPRLEDVIGLDLNDVDDSQTFRGLVKQVASAVAGVVAEEPEWEGATGRGFGYTEILVADYKGQAPRAFTVQQSSLATECKVWIGSGEHRAHMSIDEATRVRDALNAFLADAWVTVDEEGQVER